MNEPPLLIDGARVIEYAVFDQSVMPTGRISMTVGGLPLDLNSVRAIAIAENLVEGGVFLLHCDERWGTLGAGHHDSAASARQSAHVAYSGVAGQWKRFRELDAKDRAEVESTRSYLRQLAQQYPNDGGGHAA